MSIEWKDSYCVGDVGIDRQHQLLFALANDMLLARDQADLRLCAAKLYRHVREHFSDEEALMRMVDFPGYSAHVESHNLMLGSLNALSQTIAQDAIDPNAVTAFVNNWALRHIPVDDAEVAAFITARNSS